MEMINQLLNKQSQLASFIENFTTNTNKTGRANRTAGYLNTRIELLNNYFKDFCTNHFALSSSIKEASRSEYNYFEIDLFSEVESIFSVALGQIKEELDALVATIPQVTLASLSSTYNRNNIVNVLSFRCKFRSLVDFRMAIIQGPLRLGCRK